MTDYELERYCDRHPLCDCNCMRCPGFAAYWREELGWDDEDDEEADEECENDIDFNG